MKLLFIANERIPSEKANSINIVKMCSSLASLGQEVTLVIPKRNNPIQENIFDYYGVEKNFQIHSIDVPETMNFGKYGFLWNQFIFSLKIFLNTKWKKKEYVVFTRDIYTSLFLHARGYMVFHDLHGFPEKSHWFWKYVLRKMDGIVCTNEWKMKQCFEKYNIPREKMIVARNGFDPEMFVQKQERKTKVDFGLPFEKPVVLYTGHFYDWKGAHVLAEAAKELTELSVVLVGGSKEDVARFSSKFSGVKNLFFVSHLPQRDVAGYIALCDVLVLPNSVQSVDPRLSFYSKFDTSPIKMFEYMASGKPIVASDIPSVREVLDDSTAVFFEPDNPQDLASKIQFAMKNFEKMDTLQKNAKEKSKEFTWRARSEKILQFIEKIVNTLK